MRRHIPRPSAAVVVACIALLIARVFVTTRDAANALADRAFNLIVVC